MTSDDKMVSCQFPNCGKTRSLTEKFCAEHKFECELLVGEIDHQAAIVSALAASALVRMGTETFYSLQEARSDLDEMRRRYRIYLKLAGAIS